MAKARAEYYVSVCPETKQVFICKVGVDNNLCMVFDHGKRSDTENARKIVDTLNRGGKKHG